MSAVEVLKTIQTSGSDAKKLSIGHGELMISSPGYPLMFHELASTLSAHKSRQSDIMAVVQELESPVATSATLRLAFSTWMGKVLEAQELSKHCVSMFHRLRAFEVYLSEYPQLLVDMPDDYQQARSFIVKVMTEYLVIETKNYHLLKSLDDAVNVRLGAAYSLFLTKLRQNVLSLMMGNQNSLEMYNLLGAIMSLPTTGILTLNMTNILSFVKRIRGNSVEGIVTMTKAIIDMDENLISRAWLEMFRMLPYVYQEPSKLPEHVAPHYHPHHMKMKCGACFN